MTPTGVELSSASQEKTQTASERGTESGTRAAGIDADLAQVIAAWPGLAAQSKAAIMTLITARAG
jgi:hypothetical protein